MDTQSPKVEGSGGLLWIRGSGICRDWNGIRYKLGMSGKNVGATALSMNVAQSFRRAGLPAPTFTSISK